MNLRCRELVRGLTLSMLVTPGVTMAQDKAVSLDEHPNVTLHYVTRVPVRRIVSRCSVA